MGMLSEVGTAAPLPEMSIMRAVEVRPSSSSIVRMQGASTRWRCARSMSTTTFKLPTVLWCSKNAVDSPVARWFCVRSGGFKYGKFHPAWRFEECAEWLVQPSQASCVTEGRLVSLRDRCSSSRHLAQIALWSIIEVNAGETRRSAFSPQSPRTEPDSGPEICITIPFFHGE